jgi:DNA-binding response OmpR family regulator
MKFLSYNANMPQPTKIAIIEDDVVIAQMYRMKFETEGFEVQIAENGRLGVELCEKLRPDIILLDLKMPEMPGEEALRRIRSTAWGKHVPVIVLTNLGEEEAPKSLTTLGIHSYIVKAELTPRQVTERVKQVLADAQSLDELT